MEFVKLLGVKQPLKSNGKRYYPVKLKNLVALGYSSMPKASGKSWSDDRPVMEILEGLTVPPEFDDYGSNTADVG